MEQIYNQDKNMSNNNGENDNAQEMNKPQPDDNNN